MRKLFCLLLFLFFPVATALAQTGEITGTVTDSTTGESLPGVNVVIAGTQQGAATNAEGVYTLAVEPGTYDLQASYVGYATQTVEGVEVAAGETTEVDIALAPSAVELEEVVAIGYGEQQRRDVTGSISSVEGTELNNITTSSAAQTLQGRVAGVQVTPQSGEPGSDAVVRIRGVGTLNDTSPLFVVDGMLTGDISFLNPQDIESVEVLKDASATAIYGSRGANGVVIVSTQQGEYGQETQFSFNTYYGWQDVMNPIDLVGPQEYAMLANELVRNEQGEDADLPFENPDAVQGGTDWQDEVFRTAPIQSYQLSARGGTERITYNFSGNYISETGVVQKSNFQRASLRLNNVYSLTDAIELGHNLSFTHRTGVDDPGVVDVVYRTDPTVTPRNEEGEFTNVSRSSGGNPAASIFYHRNEYSGNRLVGNLYVEADFLDYFTLRSSFGVDVDRREERDFNPEFFVSATQQNERSSLTVSSDENSSWLWENTLTYEQTLGDHNFTVLTGVTAQQFRSEQMGGSRVNLMGESRSLWFLNAGQSEGQTNFNNASDWSMLSFLFRANYSYLDRYLLTLTGRADGSSRFSEDNRFGYFPSFAAAWRISNEPFMEDADFLTDLRLRASWGQVGNDKIGAYPGIPVVNSNLNAVFGRDGSLYFGATPTELANPGVQWEKTTQTDIGLEGGAFDGRLTASVDYYRRLTDGILIQVPIPDYVGVSAEPFVNAASVLNTGFDFELDWENTAGDFVYNVGFNGSTVHNEVRELGQGREEIFGGGLANEIAFTTRTEPGRPIGAFYGYKVDGVFQNEAEIEQAPTRGGEVPGDLRYVDVNGDGEITSEDRTYLGSPIPSFIYGFNLDLSFRGISLSASLSGQTGNEIFNAKQTIRFGLENFEESYLDRWHGEGTSNTEPRVTNAGHNYLPSERFLEDGSYLKLRNVRLSYSLPQSLLGTLGLQSTQVYVSGTNLYTFTGYSGYTPEIAGIPRGDDDVSVLENSIDTGVYPIARTITLGLNATF